MNGLRSFRQRLGRRWRSISFRSGLVAAISVGVVATTAFMILSVLAFGFFSINQTEIQISLADRVEDQLRLGINPKDIDLRESTAWAEDTTTFWVLFSGETVLNSGGVVEYAVFDDELGTRLPVDDDVDVDDDDDVDAAGDLLDVRTVDDRDWLYHERLIVLEGENPEESTEYRFASALDGHFGMMAFLVQLSLIHI